MKPLLYYFPKNDALDFDQPSTLPDWLKDVAGAGSMRSGVQRGPDGSPGTVVWFPPSSSDELDEGLAVGYFPNKQEWIAGPGYYVGYYTDNKPSAVDLCRREMIGGYPLVLGDGNQWIAPVARFSDGTLNFPKRIGWGVDGKMVEQILPRYADLCQTAQNVFDFLSDCEDIENVNIPMNPDTIETAADCITLNYCIERVGLTALGLLDTKTVPLIVAALVDLPNTIAWITSKKKEALNLSDTEGGAPDMNNSPDLPVSG